jgi:hypothetical protein
MRQVLRKYLAATRHWTNAHLSANQSIHDISTADPGRRFMHFYKAMSIAGMVLLVSACGIKQYTPPKDNEAHSILKLKYKYSAIQPGTTLGARMHIRHDAKSDRDSFTVAYNQGFGFVTDKKTSPDIPMTAVNVHPGKQTDVRMAVYFYWYTTQTYTTYVNNRPQIQTRQVYNERACTAQVSFVPEAGKIYMLDYNSPNIDKDCEANAYEQIQQAGDKFKLVKVGSSKTI